MSSQTALDCLQYVVKAITRSSSDLAKFQLEDARKTSVMKLGIAADVIQCQRKQLDHYTDECANCGGQGEKDSNRDGVDEPHECHECDGTGRVPKASTVERLDEKTKEFLALVRLREEVHAWVLTYRETKKRDITGPDFDIAWGELSKLVMETLP